VGVCVCVYGCVCIGVCVCLCEFVRVWCDLEMPIKKTIPETGHVNTCTRIHDQKDVRTHHLRARRIRINRSAVW
jgi:hypothetical protein